MRFVSIKEYDLAKLRALALQKPLIERETFYAPVKEKIVQEISALKMVSLIKLIFKETEPHLQELECAVLADQLVNYIGPITVDCLDALINIFPVSCIWKLATDAKFPLIKEMAKKRLIQILDQYGYEMKEEKEKEKRKKNERNKK